MTCLNNLPLAFISPILEYVDIVSLVKLYATFDRRLQKLLSSNGALLKLTISSLISVPKAPLRYFLTAVKSVKELSFEKNVNWSVITLPLLSSFSPQILELDAQLLHPSVFNLLADYNANPEDPFLKQFASYLLPTGFPRLCNLTPRLHTLVINCSIDNVVRASHPKSSTLTLFKDSLPPSLTSLSLSHLSGTAAHAFRSIIEAIPTSLRSLSLHLARDPVAFPLEDVFRQCPHIETFYLDNADILTIAVPFDYPKFLTVLHLTRLNRVPFDFLSHPALKESSLVELVLKVNYPELKAISIPKERLYFGPQLKFAQYLPSTLKSLTLSGGIIRNHPNDILLVADLPPSLTSLELVTDFVNPSLLDLLRPLVNLERFSLNRIRSSMLQSDRAWKYARGPELKAHDLDLTALPSSLRHVQLTASWQAFVKILEVCPAIQTFAMPVPAMVCTSAFVTLNNTFVDICNPILDMNGLIIAIAQKYGPILQLLPTTKAELPVQDPRLVGQGLFSRPFSYYLTEQKVLKHVPEKARFGASPSPSPSLSKTESKAESKEGDAPKPLIKHLPPAHHLQMATELLDFPRWDWNGVACSVMSIDVDWDGPALDALLGSLPYALTSLDLHNTELPSFTFVENFPRNLTRITSNRPCKILQRGGDAKFLRLKHINTPLWWFSGSPFILDCFQLDMTCMVTNFTGIEDYHIVPFLLRFMPSTRKSMRVSLDYYVTAALLEFETPPEHLDYNGMAQETQRILEGMLKSTVASQFASSTRNSAGHRLFSTTQDSSSNLDLLGSVVSNMQSIPPEVLPAFLAPKSSLNVKSLTMHVPGYDYWLWFAHPPKEIKHMETPFTPRAPTHLKNPALRPANAIRLPDSHGMHDHLTLLNHHPPILDATIPLVKLSLVSVGNAAQWPTTWPETLQYLHINTTRDLTFLPTTYPPHLKILHLAAQTYIFAPLNVLPPIPSICLDSLESLTICTATGIHPDIYEAMLPPPSDHKKVPAPRLKTIQISGLSPAYVHKLWKDIDFSDLMQVTIDFVQQPLEVAKMIRQTCASDASVNMTCLKSPLPSPRWPLCSFVPSVSGYTEKLSLAAPLIFCEDAFNDEEKEVVEEEEVVEDV